MTPEKRYFVYGISLSDKMRLFRRFSHHGLSFMFETRPSTFGMKLVVSYGANENNRVILKKALTS